MAPRSLTEVVNELTENKDLRAVFTYIFGTYGRRSYGSVVLISVFPKCCLHLFHFVLRCAGNMPKDSSFSMHSLLVTHYLNGAWYPKGGATEIAYHMIPIIEKAGGAVLVRAPVNRILFNDAKEAYGGCNLLRVSIQKQTVNLSVGAASCLLFVFVVSGVSVMKGQEEVHIRAPMVISNAGIFNTYQKLLPKELQAMPGTREVLQLMIISICFNYVFICK